MSWSDIFYPENPERRERLIHKNQELLDLMKNNFRATNQLIETLRKHLGWSFSPIALNEEATVKENCEVIIEHIHEIQAEVEKTDMQLKEKLEPTLYEKLRNMNLSVHDYQIVSIVVRTVCGATGSASVVAVGPLAAIALGTVFLGIDMIIGAILGSIERSQLESTLEEYEKFLEEFRPASEKYTDNITYVTIKLEMI
ncbi:hypothetical protein QQF64_036030 [Cirrhinus molitorella]|uniref:Single-pass membrane protein with coiled-coil domains 3 n=1 Tax=Cirrhinus molitorella TaxID=172907 RepID=A0ABR3NHE3_9TELE